MLVEFILLELEKYMQKKDFISELEIIVSLSTQGPLDILKNGIPIATLQSCRTLVFKLDVIRAHHIFKNIIN